MNARRFVFGAALLLLAASAHACGSDETSSAPPGGEAGTDASVDVRVDVPDGATPAPDGGFCCPPDPGPQCCMRYGGWTASVCFPAICDGMPVPSTPGWKLVDDDHGCKVWSQPTGGMKCGQANLPDAGPDAGDADADSD